MTILFRSLYSIVFILAISTAYNSKKTIVEVFPVKLSFPVEIRPIDLSVPAIKIPKEQTFFRSNKVELSEKEYNCLVKNVYHEAGGESMMGKIAVAQITINRLESGRWGKDMCKVIYAKHQFSWTSRKKLPIPTGDALEESKLAVEQVLDGNRISKLRDSLFYHATWIARPYWTSAMKEKKIIGQHIFYALNN